LSESANYGGKGQHLDPGSGTGIVVELDYVRLE
jgi:hypothetical protein